MALYKEEFPFVNAHQINLDWILKKIKEFQAVVDDCKEKVDAFGTRLDSVETDIHNINLAISSVQGDITALNGAVGDINVTLAEHGRILTSFQGTLESIEARLVIIVNDISNLYASTNNLGARVTLLEAATINPITMAVSPDSQIVSGMDLRYQPTRANGFPYTIEYIPTQDPSDHRIGLRYNVNRGLVFPSDDNAAPELWKWYGDWNSPTQLDTWSITFRIYNAADSSFTDYKVENLTLGDNWRGRTALGNTGLRFDIKNGELQLDYYYHSDDVAGYALRVIKLERGSTATEIIESRKDSDLQQIAKSVSGSDSIHYTGEATFSMDFDTDPSKTWINDNCKIVADLYKKGGILSGAIRVYVETDEALNLSNLETSSVDIDISSWNIPAIGVTSGNMLAIQNNIVTGEQYIISGINDDGIFDTIRLQPHFTAITTAADGYFATIPFTVPLA